MKKIAVVLLTTVLTLTGTFFMNSANTYADSGICSSSSSKNRWVQKGSDWYYCDAYGSLQTGHAKINNTRYFFDQTTGKMLKNRWIQAPYSTAWMYLGTGGNAIKDSWQKLNNKWYYFNSDSRMISGFSEINGSKYYFNPSGTMATNQWVQDSVGKWSYANENGVLITGWKKLSNVWYYFDGYNNMVTSSTKLINGNYYRFNSKGEMVTNEWIKEYSNWMYFDSTGQAVRGWQKFGQNWAYFKSDYSGKPIALADNNSYWSNMPQLINGKYYAFGTNGYMLTSRWYQSNNSWYYLNADGSAYTGWLKAGDGKSWYYFSDSGRMFADTTFYINGVWYKFDTSGKTR